jgi:hypothetical protein
MSDIGFTFRQLRVLLDTRNTGESVLNDFISTLSNVTSSGASPNIVRRATSQLSVAESGTEKLRDQVLYHWRQAKLALEETKDGNALRFYGIDPVRLELNENYDIEDQFAAHLSGSNQNLAKWMSATPSGKNLLLFDPKFKLDYRSIARFTELPVLSPLSVMALVLFRPSVLLRLPNIFIQGWGTIGSAYDSVRLRVVSVLLLSLFLAGLEIILRRGGNNADLLSLTANSVFLETLRARILSMPDGSVTEIQHGIATPQFDPYFLSYSTALGCGAHGQFDIHPLLAPPFCLAREEKTGFLISDQPSNTGINRALVRVLSQSDKHPQGPISLAQLPVLTAAIEAATSPFYNGQRLVFAILGGTDLGDDYYSGAAFRAELSLVEDLRTRLAVSGITPSFVYLPHPTNPVLESIAFADGEVIPIYNQSQLIYFCADYAFTMYSSAIFEAKALGAVAFSAMVPHLGILHPAMLSEIVTPKAMTEHSIAEAVNQLVESQVERYSSPREKIKQRLQRFLAGAV